MALLRIYLLVFISIVSSFSPDTSSFDAYGLKVAANEILMVESLPSASSFFTRLSPYNYTLSCTIPYNDSNQYVYAVAVASRATSNDSIRFVFIGVNTNSNIPFIGLLTYTGISGSNYVKTVNPTRRTVFPCDGWQMSNYRVHSLNQFPSDSNSNNSNNDFYVLTVGPRGHYAYAFTESFLLVYDLDRDNVSIQWGNITWPDPSFLPHAVDVSQDSLFVVFGYVGDSSTKYSPCAYLLSLNNTKYQVLDTWMYTPPSNSSWQTTLTNWDADVYSAKYDLSVSINHNGDEVLFGIQIMNSFVLVALDRFNGKFSSTLQSVTNGQGIGMGKSVGWLDTNLILVLVNSYSLNYVWSSSQIFVYNTTVVNNAVVTSIFPNIQQTLSSTFGPIFLATVVTFNDTVIILDSQGNYYILLPSPAGVYSDSSSGTSSSSSPCISGTYSSEANILPCSLCPPGQTTNGLIGQQICVSCPNDSFCSLGAPYGNIDASSYLLENVNEMVAYPVSPQSTRFDNILIENMFTIHSSLPIRCLVVSPLFWAIIVISLGLVIWLALFTFKRYVTNPLGKKTEQRLKRFLKKTDLIGEGEMVIGGLFSFSVIVLVGFAYSFSHSYLYRYPIDRAMGDAHLACDKTLTNAQFSTGLMALSVPSSDDQEPMMDMLDDQTLILSIDFINTVFNCTQISAKQIKDISLPMNILSCNDTSSTASMALLLPSHDINIQIQLVGINTIGGVRITLQGNGSQMENETLNAAYELLDLSYSQFLSMPERILTQQPTCSIQISKVINRTYPLEEDDEMEFTGTWLPTFTGTLDQMFIDSSEYLYATSTSTILSITITETSYYVLNIQRPITDEAELIFTDLLFTIVCLEIFGLGFLIARLIILPLIKKLIQFVQQHINKRKASKNELDQPEENVFRI